MNPSISPTTYCRQPKNTKKLSSHEQQSTCLESPCTVKEKGLDFSSFVPILRVFFKKKFSLFKKAIQLSSESKLFTFNGFLFLFPTSFERHFKNKSNKFNENVFNCMKRDFHTGTLCHGLDSQFWPLFLFPLMVIFQFSYLLPCTTVPTGLQARGHRPRDCNKV